MQISLFSSAIDQKELAISALKKSEFLKARDYFTEAFEIDPSLAELGSYLNACNFLIKNLNPADLNDLKSLSEGLSKIREFFIAGEMNRFTFNLVEQLLCKKIINLLPADFNDFITESANSVHISYCYLALSDFKTAREKLLPFLETPERLNSKLWGYLGDATWQLGWTGEAEKAYMHAFFIDPGQADFLKLVHPGILKIIAQLKKTGLSSEIISFRIPIECWLSGFFRIPKGENLIVYHAQQTLKQELKSPAINSALNYHYFALWLYLDQAGVLPPTDFQAREQMQQLDPDLFERYLNRIDPPRIKTTDIYKKVSFLAT
jgi:tetratricopeptide (TPR) repeat protein